MRERERETRRLFPIGIEWGQNRVNPTNVFLFDNLTRLVDPGADVDLSTIDNPELIITQCAELRNGDLMKNFQRQRQEWGMGRLLFDLGTC